jgi:hypothetical protein
MAVFYETPEREKDIPSLEVVEIGQRAKRSGSGNVPGGLGTLHRFRLLYWRPERP